MVFGMPETKVRAECERILEEAIGYYGMGVLEWRDVPARNECLGRIALASEPSIKQVFVDGRGLQNGLLERRLYMARRRAEREDFSIFMKRSFMEEQTRCLWLQSHTLTRFLATGSSIDGLPETPECFCRGRVGNALLSYWIYIGRSVKTVSPSGIFCSIRSAMASKLAVCGTLEVTFVKIQLPENTMPHSN